jgi:small subunit ribosomal protein S18
MTTDQPDFDRDRGDRFDRGPRGDRPDRGDRDRGDRDDRRRARRRGCEFCIEKVDTVDYKDLDLLRRYIGDRAKVEPRRKSSTCAKHQRVVSEAIKRARHIALLPFTAEHIRETGVLAGRR